MSQLLRTEIIIVNAFTKVPMIHVHRQLHRKAQGSGQHKQSICITTH